jgi:hypothetical protein
VRVALAGEDTARDRVGLGSGTPRRSMPALPVVPFPVAVAAKWTETIVIDHFTFEPGDRALEHYCLGR